MLFVLRIFGFLLAGTSTAVYLMFPTILQVIVNSRINLQPGGAVFQKWKHLPIPITIKFTFFNVTNPEEALKGKVIRVNEIGPFVFKVSREKTDIKFTKSMDEVEYFEDVAIHELSSIEKLSLDTPITVINTPVVSLATKLDQLNLSRSFSSLLFTGINTLFGSQNETVFTTKTVKELLFGYRIPFLDHFKNLSRQFFKRAPNFLPENIFGLLMGKNVTRDGPFRINTGINNVENFTQFLVWRNYSELSWWSGSCNKVSGTDGLQFAPGIDKKDRLRVMAYDFCRSISLRFVNFSTVKTFKTLRYSWDHDTFASVKTHPENRCFCNNSFATRDNRPPTWRCHVDGLIDLAPCSYGLPIVLSKPHFFGADQGLFQQVKGVHPDRNKHDSFIDVEPLTGYVLSGTNRIMYSIRVDRIKHIENFKLVRNAFIPLVWIEQSGGLTDNLASQLNANVFMPINTIETSIVTLLICCWVVCVGIFMVTSYLQHALDDRVEAVDPTAIINKTGSLTRRQENLLKDAPRRVRKRRVNADISNRIFTFDPIDDFELLEETLQGYRERSIEERLQEKRNRLSLVREAIEEPIEDGINKSQQECYCHRHVISGTIERAIVHYSNADDGTVQLVNAEPEATEESKSLARIHGSLERLGQYFKRLRVSDKNWIQPKRMSKISKKMSKSDSALNIEEEAKERIEAHSESQLNWVLI